MNKRAFLMLVSVLIIITFTTGCFERGEPVIERGEESQYAEELIATIAAAPSTFDPNKTTQLAVARFTNHVYETLVKFDRNSMSVVPWLAESWEQPAPNEYIFHLREGVKFHNGEDFTSEDVKYTYERCKEMPGALPYVALIETIEIIDTLTLKITLKNPSPIFLNDLTRSVTAIIKKDQGDVIIENPNGTNAYKMVEYKVDDYILLERFDDYWGGKKLSKFIRLRLITDNNARNLAVEAGDIHIGIQATNADYTALENNPNIKVLATPTVNLEYLAMNVTKPPFDDIHARKAVAYAFNKELIVDGIYEGDAIIAESLIVPSAFGYDPDVNHYEYDVDKAKEELAKSKYSKGFKFKCYTTASRGKYTEALQYDLSLIGIDMEVEFVQNVASTIGAGYEGACITSNSFPSFDADPIYQLLHSTTHGTGNYSWYANPVMDKLLDNSKSEMDVEKRKQIFKEVQQIAYEDAMAVPILTRIAKAAIDKRVKGFEPDPGTIDMFTDAYLDLAN